MGYNPKLWGNEGWHFIHFVALNYPFKPTKEDKKQYLQFLESLQFTLPCEGCSYNWSQELKTNPPKLNSRAEFFNWTVDMHNAVNESHGKKKISYESAFKKVSKKKENEMLKDSFVITSALAAFVLIISQFARKK